MIDKLCSFLLVDDGPRWRALLWSWAAGTASSIIAATAGLARSELGAISITVSFLTLGAFVLAYIWSPERIVQRGVFHSRRSFLDVVYAGTAAVLFGIVERMFSSPQAVHAAASTAIETTLKGHVVSNSRLQTLSLAAKKMLESRTLTVEARKVVVA